METNDSWVQTQKNVEKRESYKKNRRTTKVL